MKYVLLILTMSATLLSGCQEQQQTGNQQQHINPVDLIPRYNVPHPSTQITPNAYGPGVHMNEYGQPVQLKPDWGHIPGEQLKIAPDVYGPGVHMDQYGRPVREYNY
jgi:hypothetical protein